MKVNDNMKKSKAVIINLFSGIPLSNESHVRGWAMLWAQRLKHKHLTIDIQSPCTWEKLEQYDTIYIDLGVNFSGNFNVFGGLTLENFYSIEKLLTLIFDDKKIYWLNQDTNDLLKKTIEKRFDKILHVPAKNLKRMLNNLDLIDEIKTILPEDLGLTSCIIGDSHSLAYSTKDQAIFKHNGLTLHNILEQSVMEFICDNVPDTRIDNITICAGSIDIRFHVLRTMDYTAKSLAKEYVKQVLAARKELDIKISICAPTPIEHEDRKIPATDQYTGMNFYGSRQERLDFTLAYIDALQVLCDKHGIDFIQPPMRWYYIGGKTFAENFMEAKSSVHMKPGAYNSMLAWEKIENPLGTDNDL